MISRALAQTHGVPGTHGQTDTELPAVEGVAEAALHGGEAGHGLFPPFDPATFLSQLFWLAIAFGLLYYLMSKIALPRIATVLEERNDRIADDLAEGERLRRESDQAIAAYEQALAEARQNAQGIAQAARDRMKGELEAERARIEADLNGRLDAAEVRIGEVKTRALGEVDAIARETAEAMVEVLIGEPAGPQMAAAVDAAMAERS